MRDDRQRQLWLLRRYLGQKGVDARLASRMLRFLVQFFPKESHYNWHVRVVVALVWKKEGMGLIKCHTRPFHHK